MMAATSSDYRIGQVVGYAPSRGFRDQVPLPQRWYIRQVQHGRDAKVIKEFAKRDVCGYSPTIVRFTSRRDGEEARKPHVGRKIETPLLPGLIFIPDFDVDNEALGRIDYVEEWLRFGDRFARLKHPDMLDLRRVAAWYNLPRGQRYRMRDQVRITSGLFADFVGEIERLDSRGRLKVFCAALMSGVSIELDEAQVEPVS